MKRKFKLLVNNNRIRFYNRNNSMQNKNWIFIRNKINKIKILTNSNTNNI